MAEFSVFKELTKKNYVQPERKRTAFASPVPFSECESSDDFNSSSIAEEVPYCPEYKNASHAFLFISKCKLLLYLLQNGYTAYSQKQDFT